ncbi:hypothetical protein BGC31_07040 [Komagataeibacter xylinus]|nr:hypothetical protein BGC31_07040 [Komagataeibacter xylinus]RFP07584.1 hypothetical protein BFX83_07225 [Komagataeibacter xylinus]
MRHQGNAHRHAAHFPDTLSPHVYRGLVSLAAYGNRRRAARRPLPCLYGAGSITLSSGLCSCAENE